MEITYDQGKEFIGHGLRKSLIEMEYGITAKPITSGIITYNAILERFHQIMGNLVHNCSITQTYVVEDSPYSGILATSEFPTHSTKNRFKGRSADFQKNNGRSFLRYPTSTQERAKIRLIRCPLRTAL